jgi:hypothetical protein
LAFNIGEILATLKVIVAVAPCQLTYQLEIPIKFQIRKWKCLSDENITISLCTGTLFSLDSRLPLIFTGVDKKGSDFQQVYSRLSHYGADSYGYDTLGITDDRHTEGDF